jgi:prepilin-type N-terminal cleavage/methylation domain-containing protein
MASHNTQHRTPRAGGFTLVELLVVLAIIALLASVFIIGGSTVIGDAKTRETRSVLILLDTAIQQFKSDAPLSRVRAYKNRYNGYPCDELEPFVRNMGVPAATTPPPPPIVIGPGAMSDITLGPSVQLASLTQIDTKAMVLSMRLFSPEASSILDKIGNKYLRNPADPLAQFFDRDGDGNLDTDDLPLDHFVDAWDSPIEYFSLSVEDPMLPGDLSATDIMGHRLAASTFFVRANGHRPLLVSYGPNGPDQMRLPEGERATLVSDYDAAGTAPYRIDNVLNDDNVYINTDVADVLRRGKGEE